MWGMQTFRHCECDLQGALRIVTNLNWNCIKTQRALHFRLDSAALSFSHSKSKSKSKMNSNSKSMPALCCVPGCLVLQQVMVNWHNLRTAQPTSAAAVAMAAYCSAQGHGQLNRQPNPAAVLCLPLSFSLSLFLFLRVTQIAANTLEGRQKIGTE